MQSRPYQTEAQKAVCTEYDRGIRRMLTVAATGTGKTIIFSKLYETLRSRLPGKMLVLAHREELIDQNIAKMQAVNPSLRVDKEMAEHVADPGKADVVIASVATLGRKGTKRVENYDWETFDKVIVDEAHHATADSYGRIFDMFGSFSPGTRKLLLGVTATPSRGDGSGLDKVFQKIAYVYSIRKAIEEGWLVDVKGFKVSTSTNIGTVGVSGGDFVQTQLEDAVNNPVRNQRIVKAWLDKCEQRTTIAFCVGIQHAKDLADAFEQAGVPAAAVWGDDPDRAVKLGMLRKGQVKVVCNCAVLTEGFDCWQVSCAILARPTKSSVWFTQAVGRATRLQEGLGNLKEWLHKNALCMPYASVDGSEYVTPIKQDCIILDVVDVSERHSLVTLPTLMGLPNSLDLNGRSVLQSVKSIEEMQQKHPAIDFSKLDNIDNLTTFVEQVDLFTVRFPKEVETNSELVWFSAVGGGYRIIVPKEGGKTGEVRIFENMLNQWEIVGKINDESFHGVRTSIEEAFKAADEQVRGRVTKATVNLVKREAKWRKGNATPEQMKLLRKLYPWKTFPEDLNKGVVSNLINERLNRK